MRYNIEGFVAKRSVPAEILLSSAGRKYGHMADWWSYGVILYEMISGYTPFGSAAEDDTDVFRDILHTKIRSG